MTPKPIKVFIASPSGVEVEVAELRRAIGNANQSRPRGASALRICRWDDPNAPPLPASHHPQHFIEEEIARPSECDIVFVIFGDHFGSPTNPRRWDPFGGAIESGTQGEFWQSVEGFWDQGRPTVYLFRRSPCRRPNKKIEAAQQDRVKQFFDDLNPDGRVIHASIDYASVEDFKNWLKEKLATTVARVDRLRMRPSKHPTVNEIGWQTDGHIDDFDADSQCFGRGDLLEGLHIQSIDTNIALIGLVAEGGLGKTTLIRHWIRSLIDNGGMGFESIVYCSINGLGDQSTLPDHIIERLIELMPPDLNGVTKGRPQAVAIANWIITSPVVLILDGFEQYIDETSPLPPNPTFREVLRELVNAETSRGVCVIGSRKQFLPTGERSRARVKIHSVSPFEDLHGARMLVGLGASGNINELMKYSRDYGGIPLNLALLARFVRQYHGGALAGLRQENDLLGSADLNIKKRFEGLMLNHASRLEPAAIQFMYILTLFDGPMSRSELDILIRPGINGFTDELARLSNRKLRQTMNLLVDLRLLRGSGPFDARGDITESHSLIHDYFHAHMHANAPTESIEEAHRRLHAVWRDHAKRCPAPTSRAALLAHERTVHHGCCAGLRHEVLDWPYLFVLKHAQHHNTRRFGAFDTDIQLLRGFFDGGDWSRPDPRIPAVAVPRLQYEAAFDYRALQNFDKAAELFRLAESGWVEHEAFQAAAETAGDLSMLRTLECDVRDALDAADRAIEYADRTDHPFERIRQRSNLVFASTVFGNFERADRAYRDARQIYDDDAVMVHEPPPSLNSFWFFNYLVERGWVVEAIELMKLSQDHPSFTMIPDLDLGLRAFLRARISLFHAEQAVVIEAAEEHATEAVQLIDRAGTEHHLPRPLIALAEVHRIRKLFTDAESTLSRCRRIIDYGGMDLYRVDWMLAKARLEADLKYYTSATRLANETLALLRRKQYLLREAEAECLLVEIKDRHASSI